MTSRQAEEMNLDFARAFRYIFEDDEWPTKVLLAAVIGMVPVLNFAFLGYQLETLRNVSEGKDRPLPAWDDLKDKFLFGLPLGILNLVLGLLVGISIFSLVFVIWGIVFYLIMLAAAQSSAGIEFGGWIMLFVIVVAVIIFALFTALILLRFLLYPAWMIRYATTGDWRSFFEIEKLFGFVRERLGTYLVALLVITGVSLILPFFVMIMAFPFMLMPFIGSIALWLLMIFVTPVIGLFSANLFGQLAGEGPKTS